MSFNSYGQQWQWQGDYTQQPPQQPPQQQSGYDQLSFLSAQDQHKFEQLFHSATSGVSISPEAARSILLKSSLSPHHLARVWELSDINKTGDLLFPEFALALHLCNVALRGQELPYALDSNIRQEVSTQVDKISFNIPEGQTMGAPLPPAITTSTHDIFETNPVGSLAQPQQPQQPQQPFLPQRNTLQVQQTGFNQPQLFTSPQKPTQHEFTAYNAQSLASQPTGFGFQNGSSFSQLHHAEQAQQQLQPSQQESFLSQQQTGHASSFPVLNQQPTGFTQQPQQSNASEHVPTQAPLSQINPPPQQSLAHQPTGLVPLKTQTTGAPVKRQQTGMPTASMLTQQTTGFQPVQQQQTGFQSTAQDPQPSFQALPQQQAGFQSIQPQQTGLVPLNIQRTGQLKQQPTGLVPLKTQQTGTAPVQTLTQQPTGLIPLTTQATGTNPARLNQQPTGLVPIKNQFTGATPALTQQPTGLVPLQSTQTGSLARQPTGLVPLQSTKTGGIPLAPLTAQKTGFGQNSFFLTNLINQSESYTQSYNYLANMTISPDEKQLFNKIFDNYDTERKGLLTAEISAEIFRKSGLNREDLEKVWDLITRANQTHLDKESFQMGMWIVYKRLNGFEIPEELPESLKPSSMKILDDVKKKLKVHGTGVKSMKKSSNSKIDGSRFKNNDDDLITSTSRHRRRNTAKTTETSATKSNEKLSIEEMKKRIKEKRILLDALAVQLEESADNEKTYEAEDLQAIEELKDKIKNLPTSNGSVSSSEREVLKSKFNQLTVRVPGLISQIAAMDNSITGLKLDLFKLKNPTSMIGTGSNGEITEEDRRKAKAKLLLQQKMAKLTGKPMDPEVERMADDASKLNEEAQKIQQESVKTQQMIKDVECSIQEISSTVLAGFNIRTDENEYKKWELGIGLQPEVQELIKGFRASELTNKLTSSSVDTRGLTPSPAVASPVVTSPAVPSSAVSPSISSPVTRSAHKSEEERKAYIKEQARKKMEERMAKLGIRKPESGSSSPLASPSVGGITLTSTSKPQPTEAPVPPQASTQIPGIPQEDDSSSSDDDEEEFQRMEEIRRIKRMEREARVANESPAPEESEPQAPPQYHDSNPFARKT